MIWAAAFGLSLFALVAVDLRCRTSAPADELTPAETWATRYLPQRWRTATPNWAAATLQVAKILALVTAIGATVMVIWAGHTGARAVWSQYPNLR